MANCSDKEIIKRQIGIFREVSEDLASRLEKATGVKGYPGIAELRFNGTHNGMAKDASLRGANGLKQEIGANANGAPTAGTHGIAAH
jgi:catalase